MDLKSLVLGIFENLTGAFKNLTKPEQYLIKENKRLKYRIEAALKYISTNEMSGITAKRKKDLLEHYKKRVMDVS